MSEVKKFLDIEGVKALWNQVNLNDYPNNDTLVAILNAIDETKQDKITTNGLLKGNGSTVQVAERGVDYVHPSDLATVATNGSYNDLSEKPTIPTKTSQLTNDSGFKTTDNNTTYSLSKSGSTITLTSSDGSSTSVADSDTTYSAATQSTDGLMSSLDKKILDELNIQFEEYILNIDYNKILAFDTSEIVFDKNSSSILGQAILGQLILG